MSFKKHLFIPNKREYLTGKKRPKVECIICAILNENPEVESLMIYRDRLVALCANLYPYNSGHLLLFPVRHIIDPRDMTSDETSQMHQLMIKSMTVLEEIYKPGGFNIGFNVGSASGASISHLHQHIVPRYEKELGFVDIISGSKIVIDDPRVTVSRLKSVFGTDK